ncbi:MAG: ribonuclease P protein component [Cytophagales bacterium]|nr:ribonuclease P protein component [Cytophagales bacterium]
MSQTFKKYEHLCHKKVIESLFDRSNVKNKSFSVYPIRVIYNSYKSEGNDKLEFPQVLFSVSKRSFKRAVDRNLIKRRLRESYRLNKSSLKGLRLNVVFLFTSREILPYDKIEGSMKVILQRLSENDGQLV